VRAGALLESINRHFFHSTAASASPPYSMGSMTTARAACATSTAPTMRRCCCVRRARWSAWTHGAHAGTFAQWSCAVAEVALEPGDALVIYSMAYRSRLASATNSAKRARARGAEPAGTTRRTGGRRRPRCGRRIQQRTA